MTPAPRDVVLAYVDAFNRGDLAALRALLADDAVIQGVTGVATDWERIESVWRQLIEGYCMQLRVDEMLVDGESVAVRYVESGTFRAPAFGYAPTGRSYELVAMEFFRIHDGLITQRWGARDSAAQLRQLGVSS